ncbi:IS21-like element helper ATPase IstB [Limihaloglobus sulfuriphilus]|nr:IS21-like element helper ATPase IstB [Limihaloglobus sulfuriphilus]
MSVNKHLTELLKELHLPVFREYYQELAKKAAADELSYEEYLFELAQRECELRRVNKVARLVKASKLPLKKTLDTFELNRLPLKIRRQVKVLAEGGFADRRENILAFGKPGSGKTHLLCGICHALARQGRKVYFGTCDLMVQGLLRAKEELVLDKLLKKLGKFDVLMIDDFGYVKQNREEMEVLFTLLAYRYERGSVLITSNLPFSKWEVIFKDPMTTAAAIDRLVHHSVILELNVPSYRAEQARKRKKQGQ